MKYLFSFPNGKVFAHQYTYDIIFFTQIITITLVEYILSPNICFRVFRIFFSKYESSSFMKIVKIFSLEIISFNCVLSGIIKLLMDSKIYTKFLSKPLNYSEIELFLIIILRL